MTLTTISQVALATAMLVTVGRSSAQGLTATLAPTKPLFVEGEPIGLRLVVTNGSGDPAWISVSYPEFEYAGIAAIKLTVIPDRVMGPS
jgi:hypothetical protein